MSTETANIKLKIIDDSDGVNQDLINANTNILETELTAIKTEMSTLDDNVGNVGSKKVDEISRTNGASLVWDDSLGKYKHTVITGGSGSSSADDISNSPSGNISSITVQGALNELDAEKANLDSPKFTGLPTIGNKAIVVADDIRLKDERVPTDGSATDAKIGNRTATDSTVPTSLTATLLGHLTNIYSLFKLITGKSTGILAPSASLETLWAQADIGTLFIPAGLTYSPYTIAGRNKIYNKIYVKCQDSSGAAQNPTSLIVYIYVNDALVYTSNAIITATATAAISLTINAEDSVKLLVNNTTGLTGGVGVSLRQVNR